MRPVSEASSASPQKRTAVLDRQNIYRQADEIFQKNGTPRPVLVVTQSHMVRAVGRLLNTARPKDGTQRFKCKSCDRTFSENHTSPDYYSQYDRMTWKRFITATLTGYTQAQVSTLLGIHIATAHRWRHELLQCLRLLNNDLTNRTVWADETYYHAGSPGREGHSSALRCILTLYDGQSMKARYVSTGTWSMSTSDARFAQYALPEDSVLLTDGETVYSSLSDKCPTVTHQSVDKGHTSLDGINKLHSRLKEFLNQFRGIGRRYINNYLAWFNYIDRHPERTIVNI